MDVSQVNSTTSAVTSQTTTPALGKDEFMKLLVAQLAHQDPLNPLDDKEFVAQLAQFSGLEQMMQVNQRLDLLQVSQTALANAQLAGLIGREVLVNGDSLQLTRGGAPSPVQLNLGADAATTTITIRDAQGNVVRTLNAPGLIAGAHSVSWDGRADNGSELPPGTYTVKVEAKDANGTAVQVDTQVRGVVTGVAFDKGYAELLIGDRRVRPADVVQVLGGDAGTAPAASTP
jgi:flagellar basal-body rod modification protein FlgD